MTTHKPTEVDLRLPLRDCEPWCQDGDGHGDEHPDDRSCWSSFNPIPLSQHPVIKMGPREWQSAYADVYLRRLPTASKPTVQIHSQDDDRVVVLTLEEAARLRDALAAMLATADVV